ncbi:MAG: acyl carrier protein [Desulfobacterales bacterium]|nr:acyl carrier protein [Desulfobacterales bacterium]MBF0398133.1 acyl carrier protein [Desulfobacterales bacterium]
MNIIEILKQGICNINVVIEKEHIQENEGLLASGILDSYGFVEFLGFIESEFGITVEDDEFTAANFRDLTAMKKYIEAKLGNKK